MRQLFIIILSAFSSVMLICLMLFVLLAFGKIIMSDLAVSALAGVMVSLTKFMISLVEQLGSCKRS